MINIKKDYVCRVNSDGCHDESITWRVYENGTLKVIHYYKAYTGKTTQSIFFGNEDYRGNQMIIKCSK